jgi:hypothetical protein
MVSFTGAPASEAKGASFTVTAISNERGSESATPTITTTTPAVCSVGAVTGSYQATVTINASRGRCVMKASWAATSAYLAAPGTQATAATN